MIVYAGNMAITLFFAWLSVYKAPVRKNVLEQEYKQPHTLLFFICAASIILFFAFRGNSGTDTNAYLYLFNCMPSMTFKQALFHSEEPLFKLINWISYHICFGNFVLHNIIIGTLIYLPMLYFYAKYSDNFTMAMLLYMLTTTCYLPFNIQRQFLALSICIAAYKYILQKKYIVYLIFVLIASQIHSTALFMLPVTILANRKTTSKLFIISIICMSIISLIIMNYWFELCNFLIFIGQGRIVSYYINVIGSYKKANIFRLLVALTPIVISLIFYKRLSKDDPDFDLILNFNIIGVVCILVARNASLIMRLWQYTMPFTPLLLMKISKLFDKRSKIIYYAVVIILFSIYMYTSFHREHGLLPYDFSGGIKHLFNRKLT